MKRNTFIQQFHAELREQGKGNINYKTKTQGRFEVFFYKPDTILERAKHAIKVLALGTIVLAIGCYTGIIGINATKYIGIGSIFYMIAGHPGDQPDTETAAQFVSFLQEKGVRVYATTDKGHVSYIWQNKTSTMEPMGKHGVEVFLQELGEFFPNIAKDFVNMFERAKKEARLEGIQEGRQEGILKGIRELAFEMIMEGTLTEEKAKELIEKTQKAYVAYT